VNAGPPALNDGKREMRDTRLGKPGMDRAEPSADGFDRRCSSCASSVVTISATNGPGMRVEIRGHTVMIASVATATTKAMD